MNGLHAGVDEAGRGPLVGSVFAAAVILPAQYNLPGLTDSKKLSEKKRNQLAEQIRQQALGWCVASASPEEIAELNILHATMAGMRRAVCALQPAAQLARIDGNRIPTGLPCHAEALIGGDALDPAIMAASILAKVARDRAMIALHDEFPAYGFAVHKGYPTPAHLTALNTHGPCPQHRQSFAPVRRSMAARA